MNTRVTVHLDVDDLLEAGAHVISRHSSGARHFTLTPAGSRPQVWLQAGNPDDLIAAAGVLVDVANDWIAELRGEAVDDAELAVMVEAETAVTAPTVEALGRMLRHVDTAGPAVIAQDAGR